MAISLTTTSYGPPAHETLAARIAVHKADDALAPVTVVVHSNQIGIAARRALGRRGGIAGVTFLTPYRLAELLGAGRIAASGRRPVSTPVLCGAVRAVLAEDPGHFAGVHTHPTTERSLVRAHRALSEVDPDGRARLKTESPRVADVVRIHESVRARLAPKFSDEQDLITAAIAQLAANSPVARQLGPTLIHLPQRLTSNQVRLIQALSESQPVEVIAGVTGVPDADASVRELAEALGLIWRIDGTPVAPIADRVISVSDADDEVRHAVRLIVDAARNDQPFDRTAILFGSREPYARLIGDALDAAEIPWFGTSVRTADTSLLGRSLLALLSLGDHNYSRHDVAAWLASAPIRGIDNRPAPVAAWERASRAAGIVAEPAQWDERLDQLRIDLESDAQRFERDEEEAWRAARLRRDAAHAGDLRMFVLALAKALNPAGRAASWSGLASWCRSLVRAYLGGESLRENWPAEERAAGQRIDAAIDRLGDLDGIDPSPSASAFRRALELQLGDDLGRHGTFGHGVLVGPVDHALGLELDTAIVLGLAEGSMPTRRRDDPLLPDRIRGAASRDLPPLAAAADDQHRALLAVMSAAGHTTFTFPRGDLRRNAERAPSRWLLDTVEQRDHCRPSAEDLNRCTGDWLTEVPSFIAGLREVTFPAHPQEYDVRALLDHAEDAGDIAQHPVLRERPELERAVALIRGRLSPRFTRFDGNLATDGDLRGVLLPAPTSPDQITSATRLETWAACPHAYFVRYVLRVDPVEDPEESYRITPLTRGSLIHDVLDQWLDEQIVTNAVPEPGYGWNEAQLHRLWNLGETEADRLAARGMVGRRVYWERERQVLMRDLSGFLAFDDIQRAAHGMRPIATELPFGMPGSSTPPIEIALPDGRTLLLRGAIDRVDEAHDGTLTVIDYKTGSTRGYEKLTAEDPVPGGAHLQLVLYARAAQTVLGRNNPARGAYWFVTSKGQYTTVGYPITEPVTESALGVVAEISDGIGAGLFPQHPATPSFRPWVDCYFCEPDGLGLSHQHSDWRRIANDPDLAPYLAINGANHG